MKITKLLLLFLLMTILSAPCLFADIYSWTDEKGVKHYSNQPPPDVDAKVEFDEYKYNPAADQKRIEMDANEFQSLIKELDAEEQQEKDEQQRKAEEEQKNKPPTEEEMIAAEKERLEKKISDLEAEPLEYFGSQKNKRVRIGYYRYRLETLMENPDKYFGKEVGFEGNVKPTKNNP